jgi:glyceraldehyde 3-phosphate dehydrogenase
MARPPRIAINGFGRIGRLALRALLEHEETIEVTAINDLSDAETMAHLFEHDSLHGEYQGEVEVSNGDVVVDGDRFHVLSQPDPENLAWDKFDTDYVLECTGQFRHRADLQTHLDNGAERVVLSAPARDEVDATLVRGVNDDTYDPDEDLIVSNSSCTTNCLAPTAQVLHDRFGIDHGLMTTAHAYTNSQVLLDQPHDDLRRARAAGVSMIPTTTGAAEAIGDVIPDLEGRLDAMAIRVPLPAVSVVDLTARLEEEVDPDDVAEAYRDAEHGDLAGILRVEDRPLVSADYQTTPFSAVIDEPSLRVCDGRLVKVLAWYDNEWGYSMRTAELVLDMWDQETDLGR